MCNMYHFVVVLNFPLSFFFLHFDFFSSWKQVKPATPKAERRGSLKLSAIAEERSIVTTNKETGERITIVNHFFLHINL